MLVKKVKPITPGQRFRIAPDFSPITKTKPEKSLLAPVKKKGGRNNTGKITAPHRGGGHKRKARIIDFKRHKYGVEATVKAIEYDPMRSAFIMLVYYQDGAKAYHIAPKGIQVGDKIVAGEKVPPEIGNAMPLKSIPVGTIIHNIALKPGRGAACARSAGTYAQLIAKQEKNVIIKLPSSETRLVNKECLATVGVVSNAAHGNVILGKAGRKRWKDQRPHVRGTVMNPCDHPNGGGEGKNKGKQSRSKNGIPKGKKTRNRKKYSQNMILNPRK